jgi:hypothetical protein
MKAAFLGNVRRDEPGWFYACDDIASPHISSVSSRGGSSPFVARNVRFATAGVLIHVEDRKQKREAAMEGIGAPQQKRMNYAG